MSDNGWPGKPGVPLNPERDGWHWVGGIPYWWRVFDDDDAPLWQTHHLYFTAEEWSYKKYGGPVLTPVEVDARVSEARRDALEEAAQVADKYAHYSDKKFAEVMRKASAAGNSRIFDLAAASAAGMDHEARKIATAIRALGEKE